MNDKKPSIARFTPTVDLSRAQESTLGPRAFIELQKRQATSNRGTELG